VVVTLLFRLLIPGISLIVTPSNSCFVAPSAVYRKRFKFIFTVAPPRISLLDFNFLLCAWIRCLSMASHTAHDSRPPSCPCFSLVLSSRLALTIPAEIGITTGVWRCGSVERCVHIRLIHGNINCSGNKLQLTC
jgi:hypothetical protein